MVRKLGAVLAVCAALGVVAVTGYPASASCVGPRVSYEPAEVARAEVVTISGAGWGDACNDVQMPGEAKPVLGDPVGKIAIVFLQGDRHIVVARGAADDGYAFTVSVRMPTKLQPGRASILAYSVRAPALGASGGDAVTITDAPRRTRRARSRS